MKGANTYNFIKNPKGSTNLIILCTCLIVIIVSSIVSDIGYGQLQYILLKRNAETIVKDGAKKLLEDPENTQSFVKNLALRKVSDLNELEVNISDSGREITVHLGKPFEYNILKIIGIEKRQLETVKTAKISNITSCKEVKPFAIGKQSLVYGKRCFLSNSKNLKDNLIQYVELNLGNTDFKQNILHGYKGEISIGDRLSRFPADKETEQSCIETLIKRSNSIDESSNTNYEKNSPRIWIIPVVEKISFSEQNAMVVVGFASFYLESSTSEYGSTVLSGRFIKSVVKGSESDGIEDFGVYGIDITDRP